jgi:hypothetical protein
MDELISKWWGRWSAVFVLGFLVVGVRWEYNVPTVGKGGLALALGATLMPLFWDKVGPLARMLWIAMLFTSLSVEYRAIDKDRSDFADAEECRRKEENQQFANIGTAITDNVQKLLDNSNAQFNDALREEAKRFATTMRQFGRVQGLQKDTLAKFAMVEGAFSEQALENMKPAELVAAAEQTATEMRNAERNYKDQDNQIDFRYTDQMQAVGNPQPSQERKVALRVEMDAKRAQLRQHCERLARPLIARANRVREAMVSRLLERSAEDTQRVAWFEQPDGGESVLSLMFNLTDGADYLHRLAVRMQWSVQRYEGDQN